MKLTEKQKQTLASFLENRLQFVLAIVYDCGWRYILNPSCKKTKKQIERFRTKLLENTYYFKFSLLYVLIMGPIGESLILTNKSYCVILLTFGSCLG